MMMPVLLSLDGAQKLQGESQNSCHCVHATNYKFSLKLNRKSYIPLCQISQSFSITFSFTMWLIKVAINKNN